MSDIHPSAAPDAMVLACKAVGNSATLARLLGVSPTTVMEWRKGKRAVPPAQAVAIERLTGHQVTRRSLRPRDWQKYWPDEARSAA